MRSTSTTPGFPWPRAAIAPALLALLLSACGGASEADLMKSARELLAKNDTKAAVIQIKNVLQKNPQSGAARLLLGTTLLDAGDPTAALVELRKAQELQVPDEQVIPPLARAMLAAREESRLVAQYGQLALKQPEAAADLRTSIATAHAVLGDAEAARGALGDALQAKPGYPPALIVQARIDAAAGEVDRALGLLDQALAADKNNELAAVLKGEMLLQLKSDPAAALATYKALLAARPRSVPALAAVANIHLRESRHDEARTTVEELKKVSPNHPDTQFLAAQIAFIDSDWKKVREITEQILKVFPDNARTLELAGAAELRDRQFVQAEALLGRAIKNNPRSVLTRHLLAQTYLRTGQAERALEALQPLLGDKGSNGTSFALAGEAYLQLGDATRSDAAFQRALKLAPEDTAVRTSAAMAQVSRGNAGAAMGELEKIAAGDATPRADMLLLAARLRARDHAGALKVIDAIEKKTPDKALAHVLRGRVLGAKGDLAGSAKAFEAAVAKEPANFAAVSGLAALELAAKKPDEARKRIDAFLQANPRSQAAKLALVELEARAGAPNEKVLAMLREAIKMNPSEPTPQLVLLGRLLRSDDGKAALSAAQDAAAALPQHPEIQDALGRAQLMAGEPQRALTTFKQLSAAYPKSALYELRLADVHMALKDPEAAARSLRRALELQPTLVAARRGLAMIAMSERRPQDAITQARELQKADAKDATGWVIEGQVEASRKNWDAAVTAMRTALQKARTATVAAQLHSTLVAAGREAEAEKLAAEWLKETGTDSAFRFYMGDTALARNDFAAAEAHYRRVLETSPNNALALNNVAWLLVKQGKPGAVEMARKANQILPDRAQLVDTLATALEAENQLPQAIETQQRAVALDRNDGNLSLRLAKLYIKSGDKARARTELEALQKRGDKFAAQAEVGKLLQSL